MSAATPESAITPPAKDVDGSISKTCFAKFEFLQEQSGKLCGCADVAFYTGQFIASDTLDSVFCKRWQLSPPRLIISVTGSANDWTTPDADPQEEFAAMRFIKSCIYPSAIDTKCCWVIGGGSNSGVMRLLGDARRQLGGWGHDIRLGTAQVPLIGIGVASRMKYYETHLKSLPHSDNPTDALSSTVRLKYQPGMFEPSSQGPKNAAQSGSSSDKRYVPDPGYSHLLFLGGDSGGFGDEVKQRIDAECHFSAKFKAPIVYVVLGGGPVTVSLVQDCIHMGAFCVVVKGSGRAADVIAEYASLQDVYPEATNQSPLFWKLHGDEIKGKRDEHQLQANDENGYAVRLQNCKARYINIVNSKQLAIFDADSSSYDGMRSIITGVGYHAPRNMFDHSTLRSMRLCRPVTACCPLAKNGGFEVQGFFIGRPRGHGAAEAPGFAADSFTTSAAPDTSSSLTQAAASSFTGMFVSMIRRYSAHPKTPPDVFVSLLISRNCQLEHCSPVLSSLIEGIGEASHSCLIWSFLNLSSDMPHDVMKLSLDLRMALKASLYSSVIAFSDIDFLKAANFDNVSPGIASTLRSTLDKYCSSVIDSGDSISMPAAFLKDQGNQHLFSGIDQVIFVASDETTDTCHCEYRLKEHAILRLQTESYISTVHRASAVYVVCGGDLKQIMSDLRWSSSQGCHVVVYADSGGVCSILVQAIALHRSLLLIADEILQLCLRCAGEFSEAPRPRRVSIEHTISMCKAALEKALQTPRSPHASADFHPYYELKRIVDKLLPSAHDPEQEHSGGQYPGRAYEPDDRLMRRKSLQILNAARFFSSNRVQPVSRSAAASSVCSTQHSVIKIGLELILEFSKHFEQSEQLQGAAAENPYNLWPTSKPEGNGPKHTRKRFAASESLSSFDLAVRHVLARLKQIQWHSAVFSELRSSHPQLSPVSLEDSVSSMVSLIEKSSFSIIFTNSRTHVDCSSVDRRKLVAQCILRRAIQSPSVASGQPSVDMFGETCLIVAVASGNRTLVEQVLHAPGVDVHYICRCSSHPTAFGMNALLVALMLQMPDVADIILTKLIELMSDAESTVFVRDGASPKSQIIKITEYIQRYNPNLIQDVLSARHPQHHITALMFACRWGYVQLLPHFFELIRLQENMKSSDGELHDAADVYATPFLRNKRIMQCVSAVCIEHSSVRTAGEEVFEARAQSEFRKLLMGDCRSDYGLDINGRSALHHAVSSGSAACVSFCMQYGADALCNNIKYRIVPCSSKIDADLHCFPESKQMLEFQESLPFADLDAMPCRIYCGFSIEELLFMHKTGEFDAYKYNLNQELSSAIISTMHLHGLDFASTRLKQLIEQDRLSSVETRTCHIAPIALDKKLAIWTTECCSAFDIALFSWHTHGIMLNRKTVELAHQVHTQSFQRAIIVQQQVRVNLKSNQQVANDCVHALLGNIKASDALEPFVSQFSADVSLSGQAAVAKDRTFGSRGCDLVLEYTKKKANARVFVPFMVRVVVIALLFIYCNLVNSGLSPRESRLFAQSQIRSIRSTYSDLDSPDVFKFRTLENFPEFMSGIEPVLSPPDSKSVRPVGSIRMSFIFEQKSPCVGLTSGECSSHYGMLNSDDDTSTYPAVLSLASSELDVDSAATPQFTRFSLSAGARFHKVKDCGHTYCFDALAVQFLLNDTLGLNATWPPLKELIPQQSSLRFVQLGFVLHSPTIEQAICVRLLFEIQDLADISVHDRFTSFRLASHSSDRVFMHTLDIISVLLQVYVWYRLAKILQNISHDWHESVTLQDGIRATLGRYLPVLFSFASIRSSGSLADVNQHQPITRKQAFNHLFIYYTPKLAKSIVFSVVKFHTIVEVIYCVLCLVLLFLSDAIQHTMNDSFQIGHAPQDPSVFNGRDFVSPLLDGHEHGRLGLGTASLELLLSLRRDLMAWAMLMLFSTLLKHLERIPLFGPKLRAIVAVLRDSVLAVFMGLIFLVSLAYAMSAYVGFSLDTSDKDDVSKSTLELFFLRAFNQILSIDTQSTYAFTRHGFVPESVSGLAGFYYIFTAVIGNLVLSNLIITVIGDCYSLALEFNPDTDWTIELNHHLASQVLTNRLKGCLIGKLRIHQRLTWLLNLHHFFDTKRRKMPFWCRFMFRGIHSLICTMIFVLALFVESGWSPFGLQLYPDNDEMQQLYDSIKIQRVHNDAAVSSRSKPDSANTQGTQVLNRDYDASKDKSS